MSHWIILKVWDGGYTVYLKCSNCGLIVVRHLEFIDTCPCCGEKMDAERFCCDGERKKDDKD